MDSRMSLVVLDEAFESNMRVGSLVDDRPLALNLKYIEIDLTRDGEYG